MKSLAKWHWRRAKIQWNFLHNRERDEIKFWLFFAALPFVVLVANIIFLRNALQILLLAALVLSCLRISWKVFTDHLSPKLLTDKELTEGTD